MTLFWTPLEQTMNRWKCSDYEESVIVLSDKAVCGKVSEKDTISHLLITRLIYLSFLSSCFCFLNTKIIQLTLANIDSVILDLHRLGCNMPGQKKYASNKSSAKSTRLLEDPPASLDDLKYHQLFGAGTFGRVYCVTKKGGKTAYALKNQRPNHCRF